MLQSDDAEERREQVAGGPIRVRVDDTSPGFDDADGAKHLGRLLAGRYAIIEQIGAGGMARVYRGRHVTLRRPVAVKILREQFASKTSFVGRFLREARATARIRHPNVVEILDFGQESDGTVYCVMELLPGEPLSETLAREGSFSWSRAKSLILQVCDALEAAHDVGVVHRDVKPDNCLRLATSTRQDAGDVVKVIDFGIAKMFGDDDPLPGGRTAMGTVMGTADYIAPEQARGSDTDHRTDVYGAGVLLYELLTGQVPFSASTSLDLLAQHMYVVPDPPSVVAPLAHIPPAVDATVLRALSKDREARFQSIAEMRAAIAALEFETSPWDEIAYVPPRSPSAGERASSRRSWGWAAVCVTAVAIAGAVAVQWSDRSTQARDSLPVTATRDHVTTTGPAELEVVQDDPHESAGREEPTVASSPEGAPRSAGSPAETTRPLVSGRDAPPPPPPKSYARSKPQRAASEEPSRSRRKTPVAGLDTVN